MIRLILPLLLLCVGASAQIFSNPYWYAKGKGTNAQKPATCQSQKDVYICTDCGGTGQILYCDIQGTAPNTWAAVAGGGGGGDASTNTATSVDGEAVLFSGTSGKLLKRSTLTGVVKMTSGVPSAVSGAGADCVKVDGTSGACGAGGGSGLGVCSGASGDGLAYTCTVTDAAYTTGFSVVFIPAASSTGAVTLNVSSLGVKNVVRRSGNAIISGEFVSGKAYLLAYDGTSFEVIDQDYAATGGGITVTNGTNPPTIATSALVCLTSGTCTTTGYQNMSGASFRPPEKTVATLPAAASNTGKVYIVTDGDDNLDCTSGGGAVRALCVSNGSAWTTLAGSGAPATSNTTLLCSTENGADVAGNGGAKTFATCNIDANTFAVGDIVRIEAIFQLVGSLSGAAPNFAIKFEGGELPAFGYVISDFTKYEVEYLVTGATTVVGHAFLTRGSALPTLYTETAGNYTAPTTFDITTAMTITAETTQHIDTGDTFKTRYFRVWRVRP